MFSKIQRSHVMRLKIIPVVIIGGKLLFPQKIMVFWAFLRTNLITRNLSLAFLLLVERCAVEDVGKGTCLVKLDLMVGICLKMSV